MESSELLVIVYTATWIAVFRSGSAGGRAVQEFSGTTASQQDRIGVLDVSPLDGQD